jgi:hypothetical protein
MSHWVARSVRGAARPLIEGMFGDTSDLPRRLARGVENGVLFALVTFGILRLLRGALIALGGLSVFAVVAVLIEGGEREPEEIPAKQRKQERSKADGVLRIKNGRIVRRRRFN